MCTPPKSFLLVSAESSRRCMFSVPDTKAQANTVVVLYRVKTHMSVGIFID